MSVVSAKASINGWSGTEDNVFAKIVLSRFAVVTISAWNTGFNCDTVSNLKIFDIFATSDPQEWAAIRKGTANADDVGEKHVGPRIIEPEVVTAKY